MDRLTPLIVEALIALLAACDHCPQRCGGAPPGRPGGEDRAAARHRSIDGGCRGRRPLSDRSAVGQKTGWFFDQRPQSRSGGRAGRRGARAGRVLPCRRVRPALRRGRGGFRDVGRFQSRPGVGARRAGGGAERAERAGRDARDDAFETMRRCTRPASSSRSWCAIRRPSHARARTPRQGCAPMAAWRGWRRRWWRRAGSCSLPPAATTRRWRRGPRRSPGDCIARGGTARICHQPVRVRIIRCIRICRRRAYLKAQLIEVLA